MTAYPDENAAFPDGTPADKALARQLGAAARERTASMDTAFTGKKGRLYKVKEDETGPATADGTEPFRFAGAPVDEFGLRDGFMTVRALSVGTGGSAGKVIDTVDTTEGWDVKEGSAALLTLGGNVNSGGLVLSNLRTSGLSLLFLRIAQDGTGGRLLGGGSTVSTIFDSGSHEFPVPVTMPAGASAWVDLQGKKVDSGKVRWREIDRSA